MDQDAVLVASAMCPNNGVCILTEKINPYILCLNVGHYLDRNKSALETIGYSLAWHSLQESRTAQQSSPLLFGKWPVIILINLFAVGRSR